MFDDDEDTIKKNFIYSRNASWSLLPQFFKSKFYTFKVSTEDINVQSTDLTNT